MTLRPLVATDDEPRLDLAVVDNDTGEAVGELVLESEPGPDGADAARLRLVLVDGAASGVGLEVTRLVLDHALRTMRLARVVLEAGPVGQGETLVRASWLAPDYPLLTQRLLLRPIDPEADLSAIHAYRSREDVCRYVPFSPGPPEELAARLADPERVRSVIDGEGQVVNLVVERRDTGEVIGDVVLFWHSAADGHAEVGYVVHPDHGGHGFATEATEAVVALAFEGLRAHRVTARVDERNGASLRVAERLGMRREARFVDGEWFKGEWTTMLVYAVLEQEWRGRNTEAP